MDAENAMIYIKELFSTTHVQQSKYKCKQWKRYEQEFRELVYEGSRPGIHKGFAIIGVFGFQYQLPAIYEPFKPSIPVFCRHRGLRRVIFTQRCRIIIVDLISESRSPRTILGIDRDGINEAGNSRQDIQ